MSRSVLHDWEYAIERLGGDNSNALLDIAQDIYNTAFVRGTNYISLEQQPSEDTLDKIRTEIEQLTENVSKMLMPFESLEKVKYTTGFIDGLGSTLDIIDKYKAKSEDTE